MQKLRILFFVFACPAFLFAQKVISRKQFFNDDTILAITLKTDLRKLLSQKEKPAYQPAEITLKGNDSIGLITEAARIKQRGNNRRETCGLAAVMVDFSEKTKSTKLSNLDEMKWVTPCFIGIESEQWMFKEYLIYKIYNLFTEKSYKVRMMNIRFEDARGKSKPYNRYGFAIEPTGDMAKRNDCKEDKSKHNTEATDREQMTLVAIFEYMIGNTDWAVPIFHNVKLIKQIDSLRFPLPYVVPYDFDYAGAVNTSYAIPYEGLPIKDVTDRYYLGFTRTLEEINAVLDQFRANEQKIMDMIENFSMLSNYHKKDMQNFIKSFFKIISNEKHVKSEFIDKARRR